MVSSREKEIKSLLAVGKKKGAELSRSSRRRRGKSEVKRSLLKVNLETGDGQSRDKKGKKTRGGKGERTKSETGREDIAAETH